ncbi:MAG: tetratricopeptide repeat protein [Rhodothermales bacterium]
MDLSRMPAVRLPFALGLLALAFLVAGADSCGSDPNVTGAKLEMKNQDYDRVLELTAAAIEADPDNEEAYFIRGEAYRMKAEAMDDASQRADLLAEMTQAYNRSLELGHAPAEIENRLQVAWGAEMNYGARAFRRAAEDPSAYDEAAASFNNATVILPDSSAGFLNQGLAYLAAGNSADAAVPLQMAIDKGANSAEAYIYLGRIYLSSEDRAADALGVLEQGQAAFPDNEELQTEILNAYVRAGQTDRAIDAYNARIAADPENPLYRYNYGSLLLQAERYDEAAEQLMVATELDAQNANAFYNLGAAYQNKAASFNKRVGELEDAGASQAEVDAAIAERTSLLGQAMPNLERARALTEAAGEDSADICRALFQVYAALGQGEKAQEAAECAGLDLN